ncbi:MAG: DUF4080 domain-containing protein, partial [Lentisphaeria bacterium]
IVGGGPEFLGDNESVLRSKLYDLIIRGEGEIPIRSLIENNFVPDNIAGCCYLQNNELIDFGFAQEIHDLDSIASPYQNGLVNLQKPFIQYETSRGCPNSCAFCTSSISHGVRFYSLPRVEEDLKALRKNKQTEIRILDRTFNCNPQRTIKLLTMMREKFADMNFHAEFDPSFVNEALLSELRKMPHHQLHIETGVQTFSDAAYTELSRCSKMEKTIAGLKSLCQVETIEVHADLIAGLPGITLNQLYNDIIEMLKIKPAEIQLENLKLLPGTPLAANKQLKFAPEPPYEILSSNSMSFADLNIARNWSKMIDWFYNYKNLSTTFTMIAEQHFVEFHNFLNEANAFAAPLTPEKRFRFLFAFMKEKNLAPENHQQLMTGWYLAGFSPEHGLFPATLFKGEIPKNVTIVAGEKITNIFRTFIYNERYFICFEKGHINSKNTQICILKKL